MEARGAEGESKGAKFNPRDIRTKLVFNFFLGFSWLCHTKSGTKYQRCLGFFFEISFLVEIKIGASPVGSKAVVELRRSCGDI